MALLENKLEIVWVTIYDFFEMAYDDACDIYVYDVWPVAYDVVR